MAFPSEPCGRCGHDVNEHEDCEDFAGACEHVGAVGDMDCDCEGFITKTAMTEAQYEPFGEGGTDG